MILPSMVLFCVVLYSTILYGIILYSTNYLVLSKFCTIFKNFLRIILYSTILCFKKFRCFALISGMMLLYMFTFGYFHFSLPYCMFSSISVAIKKKQIQTFRRRCWCTIFDFCVIKSFFSSSTMCCDNFLIVWGRLYDPVLVFKLFFSSAFLNMNWGTVNITWQWDSTDFFGILKFF